MIKENLWSSVLQESSKRTKYPVGTVLVVGDANCGRTSLINKLCEGVDGTGTKTSHLYCKLVYTCTIDKITQCNLFFLFFKFQILFVVPIATKEIISYSYFDVEDALGTFDSDSGSPLKVNIWSFDSHAFENKSEFVHGVQDSERARAICTYYFDSFQMFSTNFYQKLI